MLNFGKFLFFIIQINFLVKDIVRYVLWVQGDIIVLFNEHKNADKMGFRGLFDWVITNH